MIDNNKKCSCNGNNLDRFIQPIILLILNQQSCSGYSVVKQLAFYPIMNNSAPDTTGVYRQLRQLEKDQKIKTIEYPDEKGKNKKHYTITEYGRECLENWIITLIDYRNNINYLIEDISEALND